MATTTAPGLPPAYTSNIQPQAQLRTQPLPRTSSSTTRALISRPTSTVSTPSVRDFAHPADSPYHHSPAPSIRSIPLYEPSDLPSYTGPPTSADLTGATSEHTHRSTCTRYPAQFRSEADYLRALSKWAEGKLYMDPPTDDKGTSVAISGFYGTMRSEDYVRTRGTGGQVRGDGAASRSMGTRTRRVAEPTRESRDGGRTHGAPTMTGTDYESPEVWTSTSSEAAAASDSTDATATTGRTRRKSFVQWMRRKPRK